MSELLNDSPLSKERVLSLQEHMRKRLIQLQRYLLAMGFFFILAEILFYVFTSHMKWESLCCAVVAVLVLVFVDYMCINRSFKCDISAMPLWIAIEYIVKIVFAGIACFGSRALGLHTPFIALSIIVWILVSSLLKVFFLVQYTQNVINTDIDNERGL